MKRSDYRVAVPRPGLNGETAHERVERRLGGPVAVPAAETIVGDRSDPGGKKGGDSPAVAREQWKEGAGNERGTDRVD